MQKMTFDYVEKFFIKNGEIPTFSSIADYINSTTSHVSIILGQLVKAHLLVKVEDCRGYVTREYWMAHKDEISKVSKDNISY